MLEEQTTEITLKEKIIRFIVGIFMTILVTMLIFTLIPNDAEQNFYRMLTGQDSYSAGKFGDETITMDYFHAARRDCYARYKDLNSTDSSLINSCAYSSIKNLKVTRLIADAVGYGISEEKIKEIILEQAKQIYKESSLGAGYSEDEKASLEEIYRNLLRSIPISYRQDMMISYGLFQDFFNVQLESTEEEKVLEQEAKDLRLNLRYIYFTETDLLNKVGDNIQVSEEELQKEYDTSVKNGSIPKNEKGELPSFEERKPLLFNKIKVEKKQALVSELKTKIQSLKNSENKEILKEISNLIGVKIEELRNQSLGELSKPSNDKKFYRFATNSGFLKDLVELPLGKGEVGGPYMDGDKILYVEFQNINFEKEKPHKPQEISRYNSERMKIYTFLEEFNQSISSRYPVYRKFEK